MKVDCIIPWDSDQKIYKTSCTLEKPIIKNLIEQKKLAHARDFEELSASFTVDVLVFPCDVKKETIFVQIITKEQIPFKWLYNREAYEANRSLMPQDILKTYSKRSIELLLEFEAERFALFPKDKIIIVL